MRLLVTTPVSGDEVGGFGTVETQINEQTFAFNDVEQLDQQVWSLLGEMILIAQKGEELLGRLHLGAAAEVFAEKDQSSHLARPQVLLCPQEKHLELHFQSGLSLKGSSIFFHSLKSSIIPDNAGAHTHRSSRFDLFHVCEMEKS